MANHTFCSQLREIPNSSATGHVPKRVRKSPGIVTNSTVTLDEKQQNKVKVEVVITFMIYSLMIWLKAVRK